MPRISTKRTYRMTRGIFSQIESIIGRINREVDREYNRRFAEDFLTPEYEDLRSLGAELTILLDRYSHLRDPESWA